MASLLGKRSSMVLFHNEIGHQSHKVRIVLSEKGITADLEALDPENLPKEILEVNPNHSLMGHMSKILKSNPKEFDDLSKIVLDHARLLEGHLPSDVSFYCKKINELITAKV